MPLRPDAPVRRPAGARSPRTLCLAAALTPAAGCARSTDPAAAPPSAEALLLAGYDVPVDVAPSNTWALLVGVDDDDAYDASTGRPPAPPASPAAGTPRGCGGASPAPTACRPSASAFSPARR